MEDWYHLYRYTASTFGHSRASSVGSYTHEELAGLAGLGMVTLQPTSTEDATVTALNKEKLEQEVEREKRVEERFQGAVEGLGSEREEAKVGAAITLRIIFLHPGNEQFYAQVFDLTVAHLRLSSTSYSSEDPDGITHPLDDPTTPLPLTTLRQELIADFKEAFRLARDSNSSDKEEDAQSLDMPEVRLDPAGYPVDPPSVALQSLDASRVRLDNAYLVGADLRRT